MFWPSVIGFIPGFFGCTRFSACVVASMASLGVLNGRMLSPSFLMQRVSRAFAALLKGTSNNSFVWRIVSSRGARAYAK